MNSNNITVSRQKSPRWQLCKIYDISGFMLGPRGGTPLYKLYRQVPPHLVGFFGPFGLKTGLDFAHFDLESGMVFGETTRVYERTYRFNSK